jgi:dolichol-phosphate mannosyltransferase
VKEDAASTLPGGEASGQAVPAVSGREAGPALSVVIPVHNEAGNIAALLAEIAAALDGRLAYEIVCVNDASEDETAEELRRARRVLPRLRVAHHRQRCGQSSGLRSGARLARADWILTLDGDGQDDPADIAVLLARRDETEAQGPRLFIGQRRKRSDSLSKRWASRLANAVRRWVLRDGVRDSGTGIKLFPRDLYLDFPFFNHMHRYLPALAISRGAKVIEVPVNNRPRKAGKSHYGIVDRGLVGLVDLFGVAWLLRRTTRPQLIEEGE